MARPLILTLMLLHSFSAYAQSTDDSRRSLLAFQIGARHIRTVDQGLSSSRLLFTGTFVPISIQYLRETPTHFTHLSFEYAGGNLKHDEISAHLDLGVLSVSHSRTLGKLELFSKQHLVSAGARLGMSVAYFESPQLDNDDVFVLSALHIQLADKIVLTESKTLVIQANIPTVGIAKRLTIEGGLYAPPSDDLGAFDLLFDGSRFVFLNSYEFNATYNQQLSRGVVWNVNYQFFYINSELGSSLKLYSNALKTGFTFHL